MGTLDIATRIENLFRTHHPQTCKAKKELVGQARLFCAAAVGDVEAVWDTIRTLGREGIELDPRLNRELAYRLGIKGKGDDALQLLQSICASGMSTVATLLYIY